MADKWILSWNWCSLIVLIAFSCNKAPSPTHPCASGLTVQCITCMLHSESPRGVGIHVKKYRYVTYYTLILETVSSSNVWVKRMKHIQKLASYKNCTILVLFSWNFVRMSNSSDDQSYQRMEKNVDFYYWPIFQCVLFFLPQNLERFFKATLDQSN